MRLYVDLESLQLIEGPGFRNPVTSLRFKRGDAARLEVEFLRNGTTPVTIGDAGTLAVQFGVKPRGRYDVGYLVQEDEWTLPDPGAETPVYQCSPSFNTVELDSAMQVLFATFPDNARDDVYVPFEVSDFTLYQHDVTHGWSHVVAKTPSTEDPGLFAGDVTFYDEYGDVIAVVRGLKARRTTPASMRRGDRGTDVYRVEWREI